MEHENTAMVVSERKMLNIEDYAMSVERLMAQVGLIQQVMSRVMHKDEHYGVIPGTEKPTLYKAGAEKLGMTFRFIPSYDVKIIDLPAGHREVQVTCSLTHAPTGTFIGQGIGSCSTMEAKYRFRSGEAVLTEDLVPQEYWKLRKANEMAKAQELIGGKGFTTKKDADGRWFIAKKSGERVEHDNPADYFNTVLKMGKKRAHTDAILTATAASDIFTQDAEDFADIHNGMPKDVPPTDSETKWYEEATAVIHACKSKDELDRWGKAYTATIRSSPFYEQITAVYKARLKEVGKKKDTDKEEEPTVTCPPSGPKEGEQVSAAYCKGCVQRVGCPAHPD